MVDALGINTTYDSGLLYVVIQWTCGWLTSSLGWLEFRVCSRSSLFLQRV